MQDGSEQFGWAVGVDTAVVDFALGAHNLRVADRASLGHLKFFGAAGMIFVIDDLRDFGDHVAAALDLHQSPIFTPRRSISSMLWRVALRTVVPPIWTGASIATGVSFPVRPTCTRMSSSLVIPARAAYL